MSLQNATLRRGDDPAAVDRLIAADAVSTLMQSLRRSHEAHLAVSGGSVAERALPEIVRAANTVGLDWGRVHIWFADERFAPRGHADRNATAVMEALRQAPGFFASQLHIPAASDVGIGLDAAAEAYDRELLRHLPGSVTNVPVLDLVLLGMGPDGHTASLFPGRDEVSVGDRLVVAVRDSPKPPPERVSMTLPLIRGAKQVFVYATGANKAEALRLARSGEASALDSPVGAVTARDELRLYCDAAALGETPAQ